MLTMICRGIEPKEYIWWMRNERRPEHRQCLVQGVHPEIRARPGTQEGGRYRQHLLLPRAVCRISPRVGDEVPIRVPPYAPPSRRKAGLVQGLEGCPQKS